MSIARFGEYLGPFRCMLPSVNRVGVGWRDSLKERVADLGRQGKLEVHVTDRSRRSGKTTHRGSAGVESVWTPAGSCQTLRWMYPLQVCCSSKLCLFRSRALSGAGYGNVWTWSRSYQGINTMSAHDLQWHPRPRTETARQTKNHDICLSLSLCISLSLSLSVSLSLYVLCSLSRRKVFRVVGVPFRRSVVDSEIRWRNKSAKISEKHVQGSLQTDGQEDQLCTYTYVA